MAVPVTVQRRRAVYASRPRVQPPEAAHRRVVPPGAEILLACAGVERLAVVEDLRCGSGRVKADGVSVGVVVQDLRPRAATRDLRGVQEGLGSRAVQPTRRAPPVGEEYRAPGLSAFGDVLADNIASEDVRGFRVHRIVFDLLDSLGITGEVVIVNQICRDQAVGGLDTVVG